MESSAGRTLTKPQIITNDILDYLGISYENETPFKYYAVDNYLSDSNLVIEVMGDYWHSSPMLYTIDDVSKTQRKIIRRDKAKRTYLQEHYAIPILYLWESDLSKREEVCKKLVRKYIQTNGILDNYHSFNYHIDDDGVLRLNSEIIIPLQEYNDIGA